MDNRDFELFLNLCKTLHFGRTGELIHMSASTVSRNLKRIEDEIGQRLFERDNRSVRITESGQDFRRYAQQALSQWQLFSDGMRKSADTLTGEVSLYCSVTASYSVLAGILEPFRQRYPSIDIKLHTGDEAFAVQRVLDGHEDIVIAAQPDKLSSRLQFLTLTHSPLLFISPATHCTVEAIITRAQERKVAMPWNELPLVLSERGLVRTRLKAWCRTEGVKPHIYAQVSGHEAIVSMVGLGFGIGVVPELVLNSSPLRERIKVLSVQRPLQPYAVGLCVLGQRLQNPLVKAFWESAKMSYQL